MRGHLGPSPRRPGVRGFEVVAGEDGVFVIDERRVFKEGPVLDRTPVFLCSAQVGEREDGVVVAGGGQRIEALPHLADHCVDTVHPACRQSFSLDGS